MATEHLLEEFPPVSTEAWEAAIARDLKGADYEKRLIWRTEEGLAVKPYYRAEDLKGLACLDAAPGDFPYRRGTRATGGWRIREEIDATDAEEANRAACGAVAAGAEGIAFSRLLVESAAELEVLLKNLGEVPVHFERADEQLIRLLLERLSKDRTGERRIAAEISTGCDALASLEFAAEVIGAAPAGFVPFTIHGEAFEEAGATAAEEVGFTLAAGVDFLAAMEERGVSVDRAAAAIEFSFADGRELLFPDCQVARVPHGVGASGGELWRDWRSGARAHRCTHVAVEQDRLRSAREHFARDDRSDGRGAGRSGLGDGVAVRRVLQSAG